MDDNSLYKKRFPAFTRRDTLAAMLVSGLANLKSDQAIGQAINSALSSTGTPSVLFTSDSLHHLDNALPRVSLWTYNKSFPGPVLRIRQGNVLNLQLNNGLPQPTSIHWHGVRLANVMDGVAGLTQESLPPGESADISFTTRNAGTYLYRPLVPGTTAEQTERGLAGVFIVDEPQSPYPDDVVLLLDDIALDDDGQVRGDFTAYADIGLAGRLGNRLLINGRTTQEALTRQPGQRVRVRLANIANARALTLSFENIVTHVIAVDGQPVDTPFSPASNSLTLAPGGRIDVVLDTPADGMTGKIIALIGKGLPLLSLTGKGTAISETASSVTPLPANDLPDSIDLAKAQRFDVAIHGGIDPGNIESQLSNPSRIWRLGGQSWADAREEHPLFRVPSGTPVVLTLSNQTPVLQVLHLHGHHARQLHRLDDGWEPYWLDTIAIQPAQEVRIAFLADNPGRWMIGSTILDRLDTGLAGWFEVT